ncbi:MAG: Ig-like domain-containing protein, partial [Gemmatimonadaceae bacterium]
GGGGTTAVASVAVTSPSTNLLVGVTDSVGLGTATAAATPMDANGSSLTGRTVTWSSSSTSVVTVTSSGVITAVGPGTANIVATSEGKSGQVAITVSRPATAVVTVSPAPVSLLVGVQDSVGLGTVALTATAKDASGHSLSGRTVAWSSATASVATISSTGTVKGVAAGSSTITATVEGQAGTSAVTVVRPPVTQVTVVPQSSSIKVGATETLVVTLLDAQAHPLTGRLISAVNNSPSVITVASGVVTGVSAGTGTINFASEGVTTIATIAVTP